MRFRPCIDLHQGKVKQIVGSTLSDAGADSLKTNYEAGQPADWFARLYRRDNLAGGHVIQLGPGNRQAARSALAAWPGGLQLGGGVSLDNARDLAGSRRRGRYRHPPGCFMTASWIPTG